MPDSRYHPTPDDDIFKSLALLYAERTRTPEMGWHCPDLQRSFPRGIINGAEWKPQSGTSFSNSFLFVRSIPVLMCPNWQIPCPCFQYYLSIYDYYGLLTFCDRKLTISNYIWIILLSTFRHNDGLQLHPRHLWNHGGDLMLSQRKQPDSAKWTVVEESWGNITCSIAKFTRKRTGQDKHYWPIRQHDSSRPPFLF